MLQDLGVYTVNDLIQQTESAILGLDFETATREQVLQSIDIIAGLKAKVKELDTNHKAALLAWLQFNGDLEVGELRYYVGTDKHTKCNNNRQTVEAILNACAGDVDSLASCIASDGLKTGACKTVLGDDGFASHFTTIVVSDVKTGKPKRKVLTANNRFSTPQNEGDSNA